MAVKADGLILAGGESRRMGGKHKGELAFGGQTLMERLIRELGKEAGQIWISYGKDVPKTYPGCRILLDRFPGCGPIGGLYGGLLCCKEELVMAAACDMPFLEVGLYRFLGEYLLKREAKEKIHYSGVVPRIGGRLHPLAAVYRKSFLEILRQQIEGGNYRLKDALTQGNMLYVDLGGCPGLEKMVTNINTPSDYLEALKGGLSGRQGINYSR